MKKQGLCWALALGVASVAHAHCDDLGRLAYRADWGIGLPVSAAVNDMIRKTNWKADVRASGQEPRIVGRFSGSVASILDGIVSHLEKEGVRVNYRLYHDECRIHLAMHDPLSARAAVGVSPLPETDAQKNAGNTGTWTLAAGVEIHKELARWAETAGWTFVWRPQKTWLVPAGATFSGSFEDAISKVIEGLYTQGKGVRLVLWQGNRFAEVIEVDGYAR